MAIYTFYPCKADVPTSFEAFEFGDDDDALRHAALVLADHGSCSSVVVWEGERRIAELDSA